MKALDKEILRLALPSILANITVPLVGLVDTAVAGHLHADGGSGAEFIGGISVGAMILNVLYWNFGFLRASTGGLTAQAYGESAKDGQNGRTPAILHRALKLAIGFAALLLLLQWPISRLALIFRDATPGVAALAMQYVLIRIWAAPATLSLMALKGWFIGMQDTRSSMLVDLTVNLVNIAASIILSLGIGTWEGLGFSGIALGTVIAQWTGFVLALAICRFRYGIRVSTTSKSDADSGFLKLNADLTVRSLCMTGIYLGYTIIAGRQGETLLACANIMMNLLMIFSYFTDGFAYAGEALAGRFIGERNPAMLHRSVKGTFLWSMGVAGTWVLIYLATGMPMLRMMTDDPTVLEACRQFLPWLAVMPVAGCAAFTWDGIYVGGTASAAIRNSMIWALAVFLAVWFTAKLLYPGFFSGNAAIHLLIGAYFAHLAARAVYLTVRYRDYFTLQP